MWASIRRAMGRAHAVSSTSSTSTSSSSIISSGTMTTNIITNSTPLASRAFSQATSTARSTFSSASTKGRWGWSNSSLQARRGLAGGGGGGGAGGESHGLYDRLMHEHPLMTSAVAAAFLWSAGDVLAQWMEEKEFDAEKDVGQSKNSTSDILNNDNNNSNSISTANIDNKKHTQHSNHFEWGRFLGAATHGTLISGCGGYLWYTFLDRFVKTTLRLSPGGASFVAAKMLMEISIFHPFTLMCFWSIVGTFEGHPPEQIKKELKSDFLVTWLGDACLWAPLDILLFTKVPLHYQVLVINFGSLVEAVLLSFIHKNGLQEQLDKIAEARSSVRKLRDQVVDRIKLFFGFDDVDEVKKTASEEFDRLDREGRGQLRLEDLYNSDRFPGISDLEVRKRVAKILARLASTRANKGSSEEKVVYKDEYLRLLCKLHETGYRRSFIVDVIIAMFDRNGDGYIEASELEQVLKVYLKRSDVTPELVAEAMARFDLDRDGRLRSEDLRQVLLAYGNMSSACPDSLPPSSPSSPSSTSSSNPKP